MQNKLLRMGSIMLHAPFSLPRQTQLFMTDVHIHHHCYDMHLQAQPEIGRCGFDQQSPGLTTASQSGSQTEQTSVHIMSPQDVKCPFIEQNRTCWHGNFWPVLREYAEICLLNWCSQPREHGDIVYTRKGCRKRCSAHMGHACWQTLHAQPPG